MIGYKLGSENIGKINRNQNIWSVTLFRSGGYEMNDELEDATFAFGRTAEEVKRHPKARIPTGLVNLIRRCGLMHEVLETGFFLEISSRPVKQNGWFKFEQVLAAEPKSHCPMGTSLRGVFSVFDGYDTFELGTFPWSPELPSQVWVRASLLDNSTLAWVLSQNKILSGDMNQQMNLHDFTELEIPNPQPVEFMRLPPPPDRPYNFFDEE